MLPRDLLLCLQCKITCDFLIASLDKEVVDRGPIFFTKSLERNVVK